MYYIYIITVLPQILLLLIQQSCKTSNLLLSFKHSGTLNMYS